MFCDTLRHHINRLSSLQFCSRMISARAAFSCFSVIASASDNGGGNITKQGF